MKSSALFLFYSLALAGLGNAQNACSLEVASSFTFPRSFCDDYSSSSGGSSDLDSTLALVKISTQGSAAASDLITRRELLNRQSDFSCTSDETCYTAGNDIFFCARENGDFHDPDGGIGNVITGDYTWSDGQQVNLYCAVQPAQASSIASEAAANLQVPSATKNPNAPLFTSGTSILALQTGSSSSSKTAASASFATPASNGASSSSRTTTSASSATPADNGASSPLQSCYITFAITITSMIAGSFLREIFRL